ncbi:MAG: stage III sporulation protein AD [Firmicutes bacterium]|nr:stage III sporulation protein AD [Clostridiales bacterium]MBQ9930978.1 stage III sporulation protein AD [Bacillota bacterium]
MSDIFRIAAIALCGLALAAAVKSYKPEISLYIVIATVLLLFSLILLRLTAVFDYLGSIYDRITYGKAFFPILLKVLGVAYVTDFTAQLCKDAGEGSIGNKVELAGKVIIFYLAVPIMMSVLELVADLLP